MQARERWLAVATGSLVGLWLLDTLVIGPGLDWYHGVQDDTRATARTVAEARVLVDNAERIWAAWRGQHAAGLLDDEDAARFRLQQMLGASARTSGVTVDSVGGGQRIPAPHGGSYDTIRFTVTAQGTSAEVLGFLGALDGAAQPLRVERCELGSRDGRKDQLDLALTVSTRIASSAGRATRRLSGDQRPWIPDLHDTAIDKAVVAARPFLNDRHAERQAAAAAPTAAVAKASGWALVGTVVRPDAVQAFLRDLGDGTERRAGIGEEVAEGRITAIDAAGMHLTMAAGERLVPVGCDLNGQPVAIAAAAARTSTSPPSAPAGGPTVSPLAVPAITPDPDRDAILQRLRQQRNRAR